MKRDGDSTCDSSEGEGNSPKRTRFDADESQPNIVDEGGISFENEESSGDEEREESISEMTEFLQKHADLTSEQLEEAQKNLQQHGIKSLDSLRPYAQKDLIKNFELTEETAKKIHFAIMKNTCILFAEWAESGGIPSPISGSAGPSESVSTLQKDGEVQSEQQQSGCRMS